jgi:LacI family transcriptional regulator
VKITIKDVAKYAGVSFKTVSRVINGEASVKAETQQKVQHAIAALNYQPNSAARNLASANTYAIGYVYDNPNAYYIIEMQNGILQACHQRGYELIIHPCDAKQANIGEDILRMVTRSRLAGLVLSPPLSEMSDVLEQLDANQIPYVRIVSGNATASNKSPCVFIHDKEAAFNIVQHLIAQGHSRIGFIAGDPDHGSTAQRQLGYQEALAAAQIPLAEELVIQGHYSFNSGVEGMQQLLSLAQPPTALFACNDEIASGALFAARLNNLEVPAQMAIAGFENSPFSRQTWPNLTTAEQPTELIAQQAAHKLIDFIRATHPDSKANISHIHVEPQLLIRPSTDPEKIGPCA